MIGLVMASLAIAQSADASEPGGPSCTIGDYISVCDFVPARTGAYRVVTTVQAVAKGGPNAIATEYVINDVPCARVTSRWNKGIGSASARCIGRLTAGGHYRIVAYRALVLNAANRGNVEIAIDPTNEAPTIADPQSAP